MSAPVARKKTSSLPVRWPPLSQFRIVKPEELAEYETTISDDYTEINMTAGPAHNYTEIKPLGLKVNFLPEIKVRPYLISPILTTLSSAPAASMYPAQFKPMGVSRNFTKNFFPIRSKVEDSNNAKIQQSQNPAPKAKTPAVLGGNGLLDDSDSEDEKLQRNNRQGNNVQGNNIQGNLQGSSGAGNINQNYNMSGGSHSTGADGMRREGVHARSSSSNNIANNSANNNANSNHLFPVPSPGMAAQASGSVPALARPNASPNTGPSPGLAAPRWLSMPSWQKQYGLPSPTVSASSRVSAIYIPSHYMTKYSFSTTQAPINYNVQAPPVKFPPPLLPSQVIAYRPGSLLLLYSGLVPSVEGWRIAECEVIELFGEPEGVVYAGEGDADRTDDHGVANTEILNQDVNEEDQEVANTEILNQDVNQEDQEVANTEIVNQDVNEEVVSDGDESMHSNSGSDSSPIQMQVPAGVQLVQLLPVEEELQGLNSPNGNGNHNINGGNNNAFAGNGNANINMNVANVNGNINAATHDPVPSSSSSSNANSNNANGNANAASSSSTSTKRTRKHKQEQRELVEKEEAYLRRKADNRRAGRNTIKAKMGNN